MISPVNSFKALLSLFSSLLSLLAAPESFQSPKKQSIFASQPAEQLQRLRLIAHHQQPNYAMYKNAAEKDDDHDLHPDSDTCSLHGDDKVKDIPLFFVKAVPMLIIKLALDLTQIENTY